MALTNTVTPSGRFVFPRSPISISAGGNRLNQARTENQAAPNTPGIILDGFDNKVTNYAAANPEKKPAGNLLNTRAAGFGIVRLNTKTRQITMECWPRNVDVTDPAAKQYPGWPRTISQFDNYNPPSWGKLGELTFDVDSPVVQLVDSDSGEILYTVRVNGKSFVPGSTSGKDLHYQSWQRRTRDDRCQRCSSGQCRTVSAFEVTDVNSSYDLWGNSRFVSFCSLFSFLLMLMRDVF